MLGFLSSASMPMRAISLHNGQPAHRMPFLPQQAARQLAACERMLKVHLVDSAHQRQLTFAHPTEPVVCSNAPANVQQRGLSLHRKLVVAAGLCLRSAVRPW